MLKNVKITGIHGYLGTLISQSLTQKGYKVSGIPHEALVIDNPRLAKEIEECDILINLAGSTILQRWTTKNRTDIYNSRVYSTLAIVSSIKKLKAEKRPKLVINASAVGIYENNKTHDESSTSYNKGFLGRICLNWEKALHNLPKGVDSTIFRMGVVIGKEAKIIKKTLPLFKLGVGAKIGNGQHPFPFIHESDVVKAFVSAVEGSLQPDIYNLVSPDQINSHEFRQAMGRAVNRKPFLIVPSALLRMIYGKSATLILESPTVIPKKLMDSEFSFAYSTIDSCLADLTS